MTQLQQIWRSRGGAGAQAPGAGTVLRRVRPLSSQGIAVGSSWSWLCGARACALPDQGIWRPCRGFLLVLREVRVVAGAVSRRVSVAAVACWFGGVWRPERRLWMVDAWWLFGKPRGGGVGRGLWSCGRQGRRRLEFLARSGEGAVPCPDTDLEALLQLWCPLSFAVGVGIGDHCRWVGGDRTERKLRPSLTPVSTTPVGAASPLGGDADRKSVV